ncbi:MAG: polyprenyl synthetase family protein [Christensenellales bacterium]|jgi:geranylgeranyl diphosphate synthase type II|nr:polyprenyl synthetase family protein [Clostridiales bacterium]
MSDFQSQYSDLQNRVEQALQAAVPLPLADWPSAGVPTQLAQAMRYSLLAGGKRLRPVLLLAAYGSLHDDLTPALPFAVAVECIHTYSLVHDDLPAMDDDDLRRGKPTNHKVFGEAMAILAGDALLNLAFELMSESKLPRAMDVIKIIASRSGAAGMIAGQTADILMSNQPADQDMVRYIHQHKTADLITAPVLAGLTLAQADEQQLHSGQIYAGNLGIAFQITDDLLDLQGDPVLTGKQGQRDAALGKLTWPAVVGVDQAQADAELAINTAVKAAENLGKNASFFQSLALSIPKRVR